MPKTIRIGVIGAGANTVLHHIPKLQAQPDVEIVGVVNRTRSSGERVSKQFGIPRVYEHWQAAVEDADTDAIVIGTWPYLHAPISMAGLRAGKHVMTEARMACNATEARAMLEAARARPDLIAQIVPAPMSLGVDRTLKRLLTESWLGRLLLIEHSATVPFPEPEPAWHWRKDRALSGLNIGMLGIVYEMIMRWAGEATSVTAMTRTFMPHLRDEQGRQHITTVPDHVDVLAEMAGGAQLHLQQSCATTMRSDSGTWLHGTEGVLRFHDGALFGAQAGDEALRAIEIPDHERGGWRVEEEFIQAIRGEESITHTRFEEGVKYMDFVEAVSRSAASGQRISLPLWPAGI